MNVTAYIGSGPTPTEHGWFYDYQTFITGLLALAAALIAAEIARRQLKAARDQLAETKRQADRDRAGKLRAARASLPTVLSAVCDYAEETGRHLNGVWPLEAKLYPSDINVLTTYRIKVTTSAFPADTLQSLERVVELTESSAVADRIESVLREVQVLGARTRKLGVGDDVSIDNLSAYILQAASIYARAESLFEYARRQSDGLATEPLWDRVFAALSIMGVRRENVLAMARREREHGDTPGEADTRAAY